MDPNSDYDDDVDTMQSVLSGLGEDPQIDLSKPLPHHTTPVRELSGADLPVRNR